MSSRSHYCRCYPRGSEHRVATEWYCFVHRRHLCDNCVHDELDNRHVNCVVGKYQDYLRQATYEWPNRCVLCEDAINNDPLAAVRLMCKCVFHSKCLRQFLVNQPSNNVGCPKCGIPVTQGSEGSSKLAHSMKKFLKLTARDRLFQKKKPTDKPKSKVFPESKTDSLRKAKARVSLLATPTDSTSVSHSHSATGSPPPPDQSDFAHRVDIEERRPLISERGNQTRHRTTHRSPTPEIMPSVRRTAAHSGIGSAPMKALPSRVGPPLVSQKTAYSIVIALFFACNLLMAYLVLFRDSQKNTSPQTPAAAVGHPRLQNR